MKKIKLMAFETSCDDTCAAIISDGIILSNEAATSLKQHRKFGGIVPEIAARSHEENIASVYQQAIKKAKINPKNITHIAYTNNPGLPGSLHIGKIFAKSIASLLEIEALPIDHMMGHIFSYSINKIKEIKFPFLGVVISGGHTTIYKFTSIDNFSVLNETCDDPAGECLDKIGRVLDLPYPGGISLDKKFDKRKANLQLIKHYAPEDPFSFSGIKTHVTNLVNNSKMKKTKIDVDSIGSSSLNWVIDEIIIKIKHYQSKENLHDVVIGGGVSANQLLRTKLEEERISVMLPEQKYTGDNAAMIANYAYLLLNKK